MKQKNKRQELKQDIENLIFELKLKISELSRAQYVYGLQQKNRKQKTKNKQK